MIRKHIYIILFVFGIVFQATAQENFKPGSSRKEGPDANQETKKKSVPSVIKTWQLTDQGAWIRPSELDTALTFYHLYLPFEQNSISTNFTGNNGGAYQSNDFFARKYQSDFYFFRSFDAYALYPEAIKYFNTTTPYTLLDYSQSENRSTKNETRFNVFHSQNTNSKFNFGFIYDQTKSTGHYQWQENKNHFISLFSSYNSDHYVMHGNLIFNRLSTEENGGIQKGQALDEAQETEDLLVKYIDATSEIQNNILFLSNEYRLGKTVEVDSADYVIDSFIPRVGFIHQVEFSGSNRSFNKKSLDDNYFTHIYIDSLATNDTTKYSRLTNIFQIKFYEAPDRKYTFGKRAYIGNDQLWYTMPNPDASYNDKQSNTFVGGGIFRNEGSFWQWGVDGRLYLTGYRSGQTEFNGYINKPLRIGKDTTSLRVEGVLKTIVPDYFEQKYFANNFQWNNHFSNINEMTVRGSIYSQEFKLKVGANYSLLGNYIYNGADALPKQAGNELLVLSAYLNKDFVSRHWHIRTQALWQSSSREEYLHLPTLSGFISLNYRTLWSKVLYTQLGIDARFNTKFYADAYEPATARFYWQDNQKIGNYPFIDLHANLKLKRTRVFFRVMNVGAGLLPGEYYVAPDYPLYRRTYRLGVAWSFYD